MHSVRRIIRPRETSRRTGYSISQIWRLEKKSKFPQRVQLSEHSVGHFEDEVDDWIRNRIRCVAFLVRRPREA
jgi:predicted DNA-binding transcriptional regulator AlpA